MKEIKVGKLICIVIGINIIIGIFMSEFFDGKAVRNLAVVIIKSVILLVLLIVGKVNKKIVFERIADFKKKFKFKEIILIVITQILISLALAHIISSIMYVVNPEKAIEIMETKLFSEDTVFQLFLAVIIATIIAPLLEEIVFRRILFTRFSRKIGILGGAIVSSVLFGLLHLELAMIGAMVFGVTCCILYRKYNNILISMSMHFINNSIAMGMVVISSLIDRVLGSSEPVDYTMTASEIRFNIILGGVALVIAMIMFGRFIYKNKIYLKKDENINSLSL